MGLFPILKPIVPEIVPDSPGQKIDKANGFSPEVAKYAEMLADYLPDLSTIDPTLEEANQAVAANTQQVVMAEEIDKQLGERISLDERMLKAKTSIHGRLAGHQKFLADNLVKLQGINQQHLLDMAGVRQTQQVQQARINGIVAARAHIANRMRGGAA